MSKLFHTSKWDLDFIWDIIILWNQNIFINPSQCWFNVGPASQRVDQHWTNIGSVCYIRPYIYMFQAITELDNIIFPRSQTRGLVETVLKSLYWSGDFLERFFLFDPSLTSGMSAALMQDHCLRDRPYIKQHMSACREFHWKCDRQ